MNKYKAEVTFAGDDHAFIIWEMEAVCMESLVDDLVKKLRGWLGARGMYLKKASETSFEIKLVTISLGWIEISRVVPFIGVNFRGIEGKNNAE